MNDSRVLLAQLERIATDVGRLRRLTPEETSSWWALDRIAQAVETIDCVLQPSAAELYRDNVAVSGDHDLSMLEALRVADEHTRKLRELLGDGVRDNPVALRAVA